MTKKLRKKVAVKNEEKVEPEEVSNQENKNSEFEQQVNENESKTLQLEIKDAELVEYVVPIETIQYLKEDIEVQKQSPITVLWEEDEKYLFDDDKIPVTNVARFSTEEKLHTHCDEEAL